MDKEIVTANQQVTQMAQPKQVSLIQNGNDNTQIGYVEKLEQNVNIDISEDDIISAISKLFRMKLDLHKSHRLEWERLRTDAFNLFVLENEDYDCGAFSVSKWRSLVYTSDEYQKEYRLLDDYAKAEIMKLPCVFARRNKYFGHTDANHFALLGRVTQIVCQRDNIRFNFEGFGYIHQQLINENVSLFHLASAPLRNELDEEHWSIRPGSLQEAVAKVGVTIN